MQPAAFDYTAPFLTPMALLTSARAFQNAQRVPGLASTVQRRLQNAALPTLYTILYNFDNVTAFAKSEGLAWPYNSTSKAELFQQFVAGCAQHPGGPIVKISESVFPHTIADFKVALGLNKTASPGASYGVAQCNA